MKKLITICLLVMMSALTVFAGSKKTVEGVISKIKKNDFTIATSDGDSMKIKVWDNKLKQANAAAKSGETKTFILAERKKKGSYYLAKIKK